MRWRERARRDAAECVYEGSEAVKYGKFRKRPVVIEAFQVPTDEDMYVWGRLCGWLGPGGSWQVNEQHGIDIQTLEGTMRADPGDWIIRGVKNELYPCKDDIFQATYELVE
jgi:hypothetical protein